MSAQASGLLDAVGRLTGMVGAAKPTARPMARVSPAGRSRSKPAAPLSSAAHRPVPPPAPAASSLPLDDQFSDF